MSSISFLSNIKKTVTPYGFGLIELMVSISIMALIMGVVLTRQDTFNSAVLLRSQAYGVALQLREIQLSEVSAVSIAGNYRTLLGVTFTGGENTYQIAQHTITGGDLDPGTLLGKQGVLDKRFKIREVRMVDGSGTTVLNDGVSIVFVRPNFDALFFEGDTRFDAERVEIVVERIGKAGDGVESIRIVEVTPTGQIAVQ